MTTTDQKFAVTADQITRGLQDHDTIHRFLFDERPVQGLWLNVSDALAESLAHQPKYPACIIKLLGELTLVASIFRHYMKSTGELSLAIKSNGSIVNTLLVNVSENSFRAMVNLDADATTEDIAPDAELKDLIDIHANLIISILEPGQQPYQSIIRMNLESIQQSVIDFYAQSVQLPCFLKIASGEDANGVFSATAFIMLYIPDEGKGVEEFQDMVVIAESLTDAELAQLSAYDLLYRLFNEEHVRETFEKKMHFNCTCSQEKMINAILAFGDNAVAEVFDSQNKDAVDVSCHCCGSTYSISRDMVIEKIATGATTNTFINDFKGEEVAHTTTDETVKAEPKA